MNDIELLPIIMLISGVVLLYGAVTNRNPLDVVQLALQGKDIASAAPITSAKSPTDTDPAEPGNQGQPLAPGAGQLGGAAPPIIPPGAV